MPTFFNWGFVFVQFNYGEDGLDISKIQFLNKKQFPFLIHNRQAVAAGLQLEEAQKHLDTEAAPQKWKEVSLGFHKKYLSIMYIKQDCKEAMIFDGVAIHFTLC